MTDMTVGIADIQRRVSESVFGRPLITNTLRGHVAEAIIATALEPDWSWCSGDYASWDFERADGMRLEVKQSAARQSWAAPDMKPSACSFDIAERQGRWEGAVWTPGVGRNAHLYIFAHHERDDDATDHRDPRQWAFYVVPTSDLPATKRISLIRLRQMTVPCRYADLAGHVATIASGISRVTA